MRVLTWPSKMIPSVGEYVGGIKMLVERLEGGLELVPKSGVEVGICV